MANPAVRGAGTDLAELVGIAVAAHRVAATEQEHEAVWAMVETMKRFGQEALGTGLRLLSSAEPAERAVGCDFLGGW